MVPTRHPELRIAIDTGGTFTDCVWVEGGTLRTLKVFSTPDDPSRAIGEALKKIGGAAENTGAGLTLLHDDCWDQRSAATKGARVALITTAGFEDTIEIGRQARPRLYDFFFDRVTPLVARELRFGVAERTTATGGPCSVHRMRSWRAAGGGAAGRARGHPISLLFSLPIRRTRSRWLRRWRSLTCLSVSHRILRSSGNMSGQARWW